MVVGDLPPIRTNEVGRLLTGPHSGSYVLIERDENRSGFHIWVLERWPGSPDNDGWDIWADDQEQVREWLDDDAFQVEWLGDPPSEGAPSQ